MPAISFNRQFLDALLRGDKQQTTRKQTDRTKVGDTAQIYIEQRVQLTDKPIRVMTGAGTTAIADRVNDARYNYPAECPPSPFLDKFEPVYYAHLLGKVEITEVYDMLPLQCTCGEEAWAKKDGFAGYGDASAWFESNYGEGWVDRWWTVIRWQGWAERYFEAKP